MIRRRFRFASALLVLAAVALAAAAPVLAQAGPGSGVPSLTDDLGSWAALVGIGLPALVALLQREHWGGVVNSVIFGAACVAASVVYGVIKFGSHFTWAHWEGTLLAIVVWGLATYKLYWRPSGQVAALRGVPPAKK